jgi:agmatinase
MFPASDWFGLSRNVPENQWDRIDVIIEGVPFDGTESERAEAYPAPEKIRALSRLEWPVTETGDLIEHLIVTDVGDVRIGKNRQAFDHFIAQRFSAFPGKAFLLHLGGGHAVSIPLIKAFSLREKGSCGVLLLDAHPDLWDTANDNPFDRSCVMRRVVEHLSPRKVALVGVRSFSIPEIEFMQRNSIFYISARDFHATGPERCAQQTIDVLSNLDSIYLSLDIDVFDPADAPGTARPVPGGLTLRDVFGFLRVIFSKLKVGAMDIVEVSPSQDTSDATSRLAVRVILEVFGFLQTRKGRFSL